MPMRRKYRVAWKLSIIILVDVLVIVLAAGLLGCLHAMSFPGGLDFIMQHRLPAALLAATAIVVAFIALLMTFRNLLGNPMVRLVRGMRQLGDGHYDFRFPAARRDEIGLVQQSFNRLAGQLEDHARRLRSALDYFEAIFENTADLVITVNNDGLIQTFNRGAERALGYTREEVQGRPIEMLFARPEEREAALAQLAHEDDVRNWKTHFLTEDGRPLDVLLSLSHLRDKDGTILGTLGISKDMTDEKELQRQLVRAEQAAAIGQAVTAIQHAIKNMLNTLNGGLYIVKIGHKNEDPDQMKEGYEMIEEGISWIHDLSYTMLRYAREWKVRAEAVDLAAMLGKIEISIRQTAEDRGVKLTINTTPMPEVHCDPRLIRMGLMDIASNALDACEEMEYPPGESPMLELKLYCENEARMAVVQIRDNGAGMTEEVRDNVFKPFFSTKKKWGTGLGLAVTSRVVESHGGRIRVESEPGRGSLFEITLPLDGPDGQEAMG